MKVNPIILIAIGLVGFLVVRKLMADSAPPNQTSGTGGKAPQGEVSLFESILGTAKSISETVGIVAAQTGAKQS